MNIGIVGCGLIGKRRAGVIQESPDDKVLMVVDTDADRSSALAATLGCQSSTDWQELIECNDIEALVVATPNKFLMPITVAAMQSGKHVLCEKPPGRNEVETLAMVQASRSSRRILKVGFNLRHHPAIWDARDRLSDGSIGVPMFIRSLYGHGGRPGYEQEWRGQADLSGGGELLDQGVHIIDLCRWFMGEFQEVFGYTSTYFWPLGYFNDQAHRRLEDNAFAVLKTASGQVAQFHTSWTQWKNRFSFEIYGQDGFLQVDGLGGSYGIESLVIGKRRINSGPPEIEKHEYEGPDLSWKREWKEFTSSIREGRVPLASGEDALQTMRILAAIYQSSASAEAVRLAI
jgi:predicted dehydrogenase